MLPHTARRIAARRRFRRRRTCKTPLVAVEKCEDRTLLSATLTDSITVDARIRASSSDANYGDSGTLRIDGQPDEASLVWFDVSPILQGSIVESVSLTFNVVNTTDDTYEIYQLLRPWVESDVTYNQAADGVDWEAAGALGAGDRDPTVLGTLSGSSLGLTTYDLNAAGIAVVQSWVDVPPSNYGLIFEDYDNASDKLAFDSSDESNSDLRPTYTIVYSTDSADPQNEAPQVDAGADQTITFGETVGLDGTVSDDGLPGPLTTLWTVTSGPGSVGFDNMAAVDTSATFTDPGTYVLQLSASDGELTRFDEVAVLVEESGTPDGDPDPTETVTLSFQDGVDGYAGTRDTRIRSDTPSRNYGSSSKLEIDGSPDFSTLIGWDLSSIAPGSQVVSASMTVEVIKNSFDVFELWEVLRPWDEQQATFVNASNGITWEEPGAQGTSDRGTTVLGTITASSLGPVTVVLNQAGLELLERWIADPASNYGVIFQNYLNANTDDLDFRSRETGAGPKLTIEYGVPGTPAGNQSPTVNAGGDQTIVFGDGATLQGAISDDGLPEDPGAVTVAWIQTGGTGVANFVNPADPTTSVSFTQPGTYTLRLTADDGELSAFDEIMVFVDPPPQNQAPTVTTAANATILLGQQASLSGFVSDDGLPVPPGSVTTTWTLANGPAGATIDNASALTTSASFTQTGTYSFRLTADDGQLSAFDELTVTVDAQQVNQPPVVSAGSAQTLSLGESVSLNGSVSDDGLPIVPGTVTTLWTQMDGPGVASFSNPAVPGTSVSFSEAGEYRLRLTADDGELTASSEVLVTVELEPAPLTVIASFQDGIDGYAGTRDTRIRSDTPSQNYGSSSKLEIDGSPDFSTLIKWDLSSIALGSQVVSASMTVEVIKNSFDVFELWEVLRPWDEQQATFVNASNSITWEEPGAQGTSDRGTTVLGTITAPSLGPVTVVLNQAGLELLERWIANPASNYGVIFQNYVNANTDDLDFRSRETGAGPKLTIEYGVPGTPAGNQSPTVNAGADQTIVFGDGATLQGAISDDGLPASPGFVTTQWTLVDGPAAVTIGNPSSVTTTVSFSQTGTYKFRLTADDGERSAFDEVTITVGSQQVNQRPNVHAGSDQSIVLGEGAALDGTASDDGLPASPGALTITWSKVSGPGTVVFDAASQLSTTAHFGSPGEYRLRLTAVDGLLTDTDDLNVTVTDVAVEVAGVWISREEIMSLPTSGTAWEKLLDAANNSTNNPNISDQNDRTDVDVLAKALVAVRLDDNQLVSEVRSAIMNAIDTEDGGRTLALGRNLPGYIIAADLVGLSPSQDATFRAWLREVLDEQLDGKTLTSTHEDRPNNWGTMAGGARAAVAVYLGDQQELERTAQVFRGWVGDRSSYDGFKWGDLSWQADPGNPVGINPKGSTKEGHSIDGALPEEMRRGGSFRWPPNTTGYPWEGLQGAVVQAEILFRAGYNTWQWEDRALLRAVEFLNGIGWDATGDDEWIPWLIDAHYGTNFAAHADATPGKIMGWTAWTHQSANLTLDPTSRQFVSATATADPLTNEQLQPVVEFAVAELSEQLGLPQAQLAEHVAFEIVNLPESLLGQAAAGTIRIDDDAAGIGWFIDASPADHDEFSASARPGELQARSGSPADGRIDLLTVVIHELGHLLGFEHSTSHNVMQETLVPGTRRLFDSDASDLEATDAFFDDLSSALDSL